MPYQHEKHLSREEAAALLPAIRPLLIEIQSLRRELAERPPQASEAAKAAGGNGGGRQAGPHFSGMARVQQLVERITKMGVLVKDLDRGLVDFPHLRAGREVFLCWMLEEERIAYWHDLESGFAGRQPL